MNTYTHTHTHTHTHTQIIMYVCVCVCVCVCVFTHNASFVTIRQDAAFDLPGLHDKIRTKGLE